ncbi:MAG: copper homeostasis protein CutC [Chitinophagales bacterium]
MKLEICVFSINDVITAVANGADRIELCASYLEGGITPSYATITETFKYIDPKNVVVMIRPRGGNFIYSAAEFNVMKEDISVCESLGVKNIIFGIITSEGKLDMERNKILIEAASPMHCTLQRAFDLTKDPFEALDHAIDCGFKRVLTSGQKPSVLEGATLIKQLIEKAANRIDILPGAGITSSNAEQLILETQCKEIHASAKMKVNENALYAFRNGIYDLSNIIQTDPKEVAALKNIISKYL